MPVQVFVLFQLAKNLSTLRTYYFFEIILVAWQ